MSFAQNLKFLMVEWGLSNYRLAKDLKVSQTSVANWLDQKNEPHPSMQLAIASRFRISVEELVGEDFPPIKKLTGERQKNTAHQTVSGHSAYDASVLSWFYSLPPEKRQAILSLGDAPKELLEGLGREQY